VKTSEPKATTRKPVIVIQLVSDQVGDTGKMKASEPKATTRKGVYSVIEFVIY
jgi:hypothetical protein